MYSARRILSAVLIFVALAACVVPALTPPARAVAVVDDAIVIGVGLMFAGLTGITFSRSDHAVSAIQKFLTDCADVAQQIATLAAESVQDGIFKFTATNKLIYATIVAAMQGYFTSEADENDTLNGVLMLGASYPILTCNNFGNLTVDDLRITTDIKELIWSVDGKEYTLKQIESTNNGYPSIAYGIYDGEKHISTAVNAIGLIAFDVCLDSAGNYAWYYARLLSNGNIGIAGFSLSGAPFYIRNNVDHEIYFKVFGDNITYLQDAAVDGTSALDQFEQLPEPDKDPDDDDKPVEVPFVPLPIPNELETARRGLGQDADGDPLTDADGNPLTDADGNPLTEAKPGIVPSERISSLTDAISQAKTDTPTTPDDPDDNTDDDRTKRHDADWENLFPFCVPFDLIEFLGVLAADPVAPKFEWRIYAPNVVDYTLEIDLSVFDSVAQICRTMELLAFCIGLILITRNIIRG